MSKSDLFVIMDKRYVCIECQNGIEPSMVKHGFDVCVDCMKKIEKCYYDMKDMIH